ncbi:MAG: aminotransferase class III-fold pyridoxal phosphate-dependent enzyme [Gammaproteobacteria bacterium]|nr:aminotransferase class III-fold pyridoxal phosphate-dependent enzyme [Gammaproteobacteria bacterium]
MSNLGHNLPDSLTPEGDWRHVFAYHPMNVEIERAEGVFIFDRDGNRYFDVSGGPMAVNLPHNHPRMKQAIVRQLESYNYTHPSLADPKRAKFCRMLAEITPGDLDFTYLVSGGSEAVETAIKVARQAQVALGNPAKYKVISHRDSYHGMTLATLGVSHNPSTQAVFEPMLPKWPSIRQYSDFDRPSGMSREEWGIQCAQALEFAIHYAGANSVSAFLATPHGCGADYACVPPKSYWEKIREICDHYEVLLIADEVVTGFGRTGKWFGMEHFGVEPDIMAMAKGISSCYVPFGAVSVSSRINAPFEQGTPFVHGYTFGGHPLGCAAGCELINVIRDEALIENCNRQSERVFSYRDELLSHPTVADVRGWGLMMVLEIVADKETMTFFDRSVGAQKLFQSIALKHGLAMYSTLSGSSRHPGLSRGIPIWISPPLSISGEEVEEMMRRLLAMLGEWEDTVLINS